MIDIFNISYKGTPKEIMDYLKGIDICKECKGFGSLSTDYMNSDHNIERGAGDDVECENCYGSGKEQDEEIISERICLA
jgi:DnaJ-class molecular chaperone